MVKFMLIILAIIRKNKVSMTKYPIINHCSNYIRLLLSTIFLIFIFLFSVQDAIAQSDDKSQPKVQEIFGLVEEDSITVYRLQNLEEGQQLYVRMENYSGNLDPFILLFAGDTNPVDISDEYRFAIDQVITEGGDPLETLPEIFNEISLVWNDDFRTSLAAAFEFTIPADDTYLLAAAGAPYTDSFGSYRLQIGVNEPNVLEGTARATRDTLAILDPTVSRGGDSVQVISGVISQDEPQDTYTLEPLSAGQTLYAFVETESGDLKPSLVIQSFNGKPLRGTNLAGTESFTSTQLNIDNNIKNLKISVGNNPNLEELTTGSYRLVIGTNDPGVLTGIVLPRGRPLISAPIEVRVGSKLIQITNIDQLNERFGVVAELRMEWEDPNLAYNPEQCQCEFNIFTGDSFKKFADENEILIPEFSIFNQQGNRWIQNQNAVIFPDGRAIYQEHYTTDLQAPLFNFRRFPFDTQRLYIQAKSLLNEGYFIYTDPEEMSSIGELLGEEEWYITDSWTDISSEDEHSTHWLYFTVTRHLNFYIFRIIIPLVLVIIVSWFTFFLRDFGRRVEVSSATLLTFVAFNFTIANNLPRIGYLTFMDALLIGAFVISVIVVVYNVSLKRLEADGKSELAHRIDKPMIWLYPILFFVGALIASFLFLS